MGRWQPQVWVGAACVGVVTLGCTGGDVANVACEVRADQFIDGLRTEVYNALDSGEELDLRNLASLEEGDIQDCADDEFQDLLAQRARALLEEMYVSDEFANADEGDRHTIGNQLAVIVLALNDDLPAPS